MWTWKETIWHDVRTGDRNGRISSGSSLAEFSAGYSEDEFSQNGIFWGDEQPEVFSHEKTLRGILFPLLHQEKKNRKIAEVLKISPGRGRKQIIRHSQKEGNSIPGLTGDDHLKLRSYSIG